MEMFSIVLIKLILAKSSSHFLSAECVNKDALSVYFKSDSWLLIVNELNMWDEISLWLRITDERRD